MDDIKLALLGNKEAAKRLTDAGVLVPCMCGRTPKEHGPEDWKPTFYDPDSRILQVCRRSGRMGEVPIFYWGEDGGAA